MKNRLKQIQLDGEHAKIAKIQIFKPDDIAIKDDVK
jgi:hypothetical protein